jgi:hypothetical protein
MVLAGFYEVNFLSVEFDLRFFLRFPPIFLTIAVWTVYVVQTMGKQL